MEKKKIDLLKKINEIKENKSLADYGSLDRKGFDKSLVKAVAYQGLIKWSGADFYLTPEGEKVLRDYLLIENSQQKPSINIKVNNQNKGQAVNNISATEIKDTVFQNKGDIHIGQKIEKQYITDNSSTYDIDMENVEFLEKSSIKIINKYGEIKPLIVGLISLFSGLITIFEGFDSIIKRKMFLPDWFLPLISEKYAIYVLTGGFLLLLFGGFSVSVVLYKYKSRCPKCKRFYALKEVGNPTEREVKVKEGIQRTTIRHYECKYEDCDYKTTKKRNRFISDSELNKGEY